MNDSRVIVIVPALNEEAAIGDVVRSVKRVMPEVMVIVIDDRSHDATARVAKESGADLVRRSAEPGLGGCLRTGYQAALELGCQYAIRVDGDGQHEAEDIPRVLGALVSSGADVVIGSRFIAPGQWRSPLIRSVAISLFRGLLSPVLGKTIHDPTSGFTGMNRRALEVVSRAHPSVYPEIGALMTLRRNRLQFHEIPCRMYPRCTGRSSFTIRRSIRYTLHVLWGVFVNAWRFGVPIRRLDRHGFEGD